MSQHMQTNKTKSYKLTSPTDKMKIIRFDVLSDSMRIYDTWEVNVIFDLHNGNVHRRPISFQQSLVQARDLWNRYVQDGWKVEQ